VGGVSINVDPLANADIAGLFGFARTLILWTLLVFFASEALGLLARSTMPVGQAQAATSPNAAQITAEAGAAAATRGLSLLWSGGVRAAFSVATMAAVSFVPVVLFLKLTSKISLSDIWSGAGPFGGSGAAVSEGLRLLDAAFPLAFATSGLVFLLAFRLACLVTAWAGFAVVKSTK